MTAQWYALQSKPNQEQLLWYQLDLIGVEAYLPRLSVRPANPRARTLVPYFPGYLFARLDWRSRPFSSVAWLPGMRRIVAFDGEPASVPEHLITAVRAHVEAANQEQKDPLAGLQRGDRVRLTAGPFARNPMNGVIGMTGLLLDTRLNGGDRARVLLRFIASLQVSLEVPAALLERARVRR
jgi:transcriptional antiterminator RfaH